MNALGDMPTNSNVFIPTSAANEFLMAILEDEDDVWLLVNDIPNQRPNVMWHIFVRSRDGSIRSKSCWQSDYQAWVSVENARTTWDVWMNVGAVVALRRTTSDSKA